MPDLTARMEGSSFALCSFEAPAHHDLRVRTRGFGDGAGEGSPRPSRRAASGARPLGGDRLTLAWRPPRAWRAPCATLSYVKGTVTIRLDARLERELERICRRLGRTRSDVVRDALRRQVSLMRFEDDRRRLLPYGERAGLLTDEDVFRQVS
jgi:predicted transcriptional regulator